MRVYLVGGAVRDMLLGLPVKDRDYVVVGSTVEEMLSLGFKKVGADFPVFLHPETGEEYALARTEKKVGAGYHGFETSFDASTTIEDDVRRRDLSVNSMALDLETNEVVDPFGGQNDLANRVLRHTSEAFQDDPVRVLRLARFAARYNTFTVASETVELANRMVASGELDALTPERICKELEKVLTEKSPDRFFETLASGPLKVVFPEVEALRHVPAGPEKHHAEGDAFVHTMMVVREAAKTGDPLVMFGALVHDFGKALTRPETLPRHPGHEEAGVPVVESFCDRLRMTNEYKRVGMLCARHHGHVHMAFELNRKTFVRYYNDFNKGCFEHDLDVLVKVAEADHFGRVSEEKGPTYPQAAHFKKVMMAIHNVKFSQHFTVDQIKAMPNEKKKHEMNRLRLAAAKSVV